ncbi:hypothetical protein [Streptomyces sp. WMMB 322]|uniref:hypothetical protein n=1 Tax=Streptomyces sp. WMMB 322 TaxID=1286821 RepID=UPI0006E2C1CB|nr:hypothetical protein [Streptomyces sp. WMMB 322]SCK59200.1 hypothetical protein H180DRAFT_05674 [Streptomyces sp. WMMB 322]
MSDLAQHLATIDVLRDRPFPEQRGRQAEVVSGPGYHLAELATSEEFWEGDGAGRLTTGEQYEAECGALSRLLTGRWGEPQLVSLRGTLMRGAEGEEMPEPWQGLSAGVPYVELWQTEGRWVAVGVSQLGPALPFQLIAAVTVNDPP